MVKKTGQSVVEPVRKRTTIGRSAMTRPKSKQQKRNFKKYRGQG